MATVDAAAGNESRRQEVSVLPLLGVEEEYPDAEGGVVAPAVATAAARTRTTTRWFDLFNIYNHPIFIVCIVIAVGIFLNSVLRKDKGIDYV